MKIDLGCSHLHAPLKVIFGENSHGAAILARNQATFWPGANQNKKI